MTEPLRRALHTILWSVREHARWFGAAGTLIVLTVVTMIAVASQDGAESRIETGEYAENPVIDELARTAEQLNEQLRRDPKDARLDEVLQGHTRRFEKTEDAIVGTVARRDAAEDCWGFDLSIPAAWIRGDTSVSITVGPVREQPREACDPQEQSEQLPAELLDLGE